MKRSINRLAAVAVCGIVLSVASNVQGGSTPSPLSIRKAATPTVTTLNKNLVLPAATKARIVRPVDWRLLNPQPLPPRWNPPWVIRGLNPQPLPPRWNPPWVIRGLNPQPLPPRW